jgi:hypothetical protein
MQNISSHPDEERVTCLTIAELLQEDVTYVIPPYQRNYDWNEDNIRPFIHDLIDMCRSDRNHHLGSLVVFPSPQLESSTSTPYEVVDGQQRLTTLAILIAALKIPNLVRLRYQCRDHAQQALDALHNLSDDRSQGSGPSRPILGAKDGHGDASGIARGAAIVEQVLAELADDADLRASLASRLLSHARLVRYVLPASTDVAEYFETMNTRGVQLEKHQIIKARMMEVLPNHGERTCFARIWEACEAMDGYVVTAFDPRIRATLFGPSLGDLPCLSFPDMAALWDAGADDGATSLDALRASTSQAVTKSSDQDEGSRFTPVITFPHFLLHVLRIMYRNGICDGTAGSTTVALDDKRLLEIFDAFLVTASPNGPRAERVRSFILLLLRCRALSDRYILKMDKAPDSAGWSLRRPEAGKGSHPSTVHYVRSFGDDGTLQDRLLFLQSALHVSWPAMPYKHWFQAALAWLDRHGREGVIDGTAYLRYLESVAQGMVYGWMGPQPGPDHAQIVDQCLQVGRHSVPTPSLPDAAARLTYDSRPPAYVFNYLDYLLWVSHPDDEKIRQFTLTVRGSIDHHFPQHPREVGDGIPVNLHAFGNLSLVSHDRNASMGNRLPREKQDYYVRNHHDSIKQMLMTRNQGTWNADAIDTHGQDMIRLLVQDSQQA